MHTPRNKSLVELESNKRTLFQLKERYPGRESQIDRITQCLGSTHATSGPLFIYGPPSSGKTSITLDFLKLSGIPHAYINCHEINRTKAILTSVLHQLKGNKRKRSEGYNTSIRCDNINDFLVALPTTTNTNSTHHRRALCIVLDAVDRIATTNSDLLIALSRIPIATSVKIHVVLISTVPWGTGKFNIDGQRILPPIQIHFPAYKVEHLAKILLRHQPPDIKNCPFAAHYKAFIQSILPAFSRTTNSILDMHIACNRLWPKYIAPLHQQQLEEREQQRPFQAQGHALLAQIRQDMQKMISELEVSGSLTAGTTRDVVDNTHRHPTMNRGETDVPGATPMAATETRTARSGGDVPNAGTKHSMLQNNDNISSIPQNGDAVTIVDAKASSYGLSFELPYMSKFLLLAAYIASRNKATADRAVFDPGYSRRSRKDAQAHDKMTEAAIEAALRGPHSFALERLLHIFYCIYEQHGPSDPGEGFSHHASHSTDRYRLLDENEEALQLKKGIWRQVQCAEVHMQLSTLVALRLLSRTSSDILDGAMYKCNIADDVARAIATNVKMRLGDYLKLA